ncbi:hypothetical protein GCM10028807_58220 [Spirosoma daeguense]
MSISVKFRLRTDRAKGSLRLVQVYIRVDGTEGSPWGVVTEHGDYLWLTPLPTGSEKRKPGVAYWDQKNQEVVGRGEEIDEAKELLSDIESRILQIRKQQVDRFRTNKGPQPTCDTIKRQFQTGVVPVVTFNPFAPTAPHNPVPTLADAYRAHLITLTVKNGTSEALAPDTIKKWEYGLNYLIKYLGDSEPTFMANQLSRGWAKMYHTWLMKQGMAADSATRYVARIDDVLETCIDFKLISENPLSGLKLPRDKDKEVYFLEEEEVNRFFQLDIAPGSSLHESCWWMGIMMLTGLDYPDAKRYVFNRTAYERFTPEGNPKVVIRRSKPPKVECHIPMLPELKALLQHIPTGKPPHPDTVNNMMLAVEGLLNFPERLTIKIARKTAGAIFLRRGFRLEAVSKFMGHSSVAITERYYVKITGRFADREIDRTSRT